MKALYLLLCVVGTLLPFTQFIPWLATYGLDVPLLMQQISADRLSAFAWLDVLVSALVLIVFICVESRRLRMRCGWVFLWHCLCFLFMRERHLHKQAERAMTI